MTRDQAKAFLRALGATEISGSGSWVATHCPLAPWTHDSGKDSNPSFAISCKPGKEPVFNCFTCHSGDLNYLVVLLKKYGAEGPKYDFKTARKILSQEDSAEIQISVADPEEETPEKIKTIYWEEEWLDSFMRATQVPAAMKYLSARSVPIEVAVAMDIRWDTGRECVAFPVRDFTGRLAGMRGRRLSGGYYDYPGPKKKRNGHVWLGEDRVDTNKDVLMVESVFDMASALRVYDNVVAPLTVGMSPEKVMRMAAAFTVVTLFDNGNGGDKARKKISKYLTDSVIQHCKPPEHCSDPGDMSVDELRDVLGKRLSL